MNNIIPVVQYVVEAFTEFHVKIMKNYIIPHASSVGLSFVKYVLVHVQMSYLGDTGYHFCSHCLGYSYSLFQGSKPNAGKLKTTSKHHTEHFNRSFVSTWNLISGRK